MYKIQLYRTVEIYISRVEKFLVYIAQGKKQFVISAHSEEMKYKTPKKNHYNEALHPLRLTEPSSVVQARSISDSISFIIRKVWCFQNIFTINSNYYNMLRWPSYERTLVVTEVNLQCS